jgi:hypothetical protein
MDNSIQLGTLESIRVRDVWGHEALDFTPWLAEKSNIALLSKTLDIDIEVLETEKFVGPYHMDLFGRDNRSGFPVIIENQLEQTDHSHLGQIITYAAGLDSGIMIWVTPSFSDEHRAAIEWLNRITGDNFNFFAVQVELFKIGDSLPAPRFSIVCGPNNWTEYLQDKVRKIGTTPTQALSLDYWTALKKLIESSKSPVRCSKPLPQTQFNMLLPVSPFKISATIEPNANRIKVFLWVSGRGDTIPRRNAAFRVLQEKFSSELTRIFGKDLTWDIRPTRDWDEVNISAAYDPKNTDTWEEQHAWLKTQLEKIVGFFNANLKDLVIEETEGWKMLD